MEGKGEWGGRRCEKKVWLGSGVRTGGGYLRFGLRRGKTGEKGGAERDEEGLHSFLPRGKLRGRE